MRDVLIGQTDYTVLVKIVGTTGNEVTGLTNTDIDIAYARVETDNDVTSSDVTPASLSALTDAHSDWGFKEVSSTDHPGLYRLDIADAVFASGAWEAVVTITDASGEDFYSVDIGFRLVSFNAQDGVRLGLTALPNAAADAAGGLPISDAGGLDLDNRMPAAAAITNINTVYNTDFAANYNTTLDTWNVNTTHAAGTAWVSGAITAASIASDAITAAKIADGAIDAGAIASDAITAAKIADGAIDAGAIATGAITSAKFAAGAIDAAAIANGAIDAATFAADVDAEILSYLVDDATRIDASALNTATGTTIPAILDDTDLIDDGTSGLAKIATDVAAILVDTGTTLQAELDGIQADTEDIQSRLPAALTADGNIKADALRISGSATAADNVEQVFDTDFADVYNATDNHWHVDVQQVKGSATAAQNMTTVFATDFATNYDSTNDKWNTRADLQTIKGQTVTCAAGVTVYAHVGTSAASTAQSGDAYAYLGTNLGLLGANATEAGGTGDQFTAIPWNASWDTEVQSEVADALTAFAWSGITVGTVTTLTNLPAITSNWLTAAGLATDAAAEIATAVLTTQMTESYRATGAAPTLAQAQFEVIAHLGNSAIASTTKTAKKLDGSTTAKTYTLDSATVPTSITEAT